MSRWPVRATRPIEWLAGSRMGWVKKEMEKLGWSEGRNIRIEVRFALVCGVAVGRRVRVFAPRWARVALLRYFRAPCWVLCEEAKLFALRQDLTFHRLHRGRSVPVILSFHPSVVWPCAAGTQNANLFGIMPPFLTESTFTLRRGRPPRLPKAPWRCLPRIFL